MRIGTYKGWEIFCSSRHILRAYLPGDPEASPVSVEIKRGEKIAVNEIVIEIDKYLACVQDCRRAFGFIALT